MADAKTSQRYQETIADIEIEHFAFADGLKALVREHQATSKVAYAKAGRELNKNQKKGGKARAASKAERNARWKIICLDIKEKNPNKKIKEITRLLLERIAEGKHPDDETKRIPEFDRMRKLVGEFLKRLPVD